MIGQNSLQAEFGDLRCPQTEGQRQDVYSVRTVDFEHFTIAKSSLNRPAFLVREVSSVNSPRFDVSLSNLRALHNCNIALVSSESEKTELGYQSVSIVECLSDDCDLQNLFIRSVGHAVESMTNLIDLGLLIQQLRELFRLAALPSQASIVGLWGELWVIAISQDPVRMTKAWHAKTSGRADFATKSEQLDVKTTESSRRLHDLSYDQVNPPAGTFASIVSVMTEQIGDGLTLGDLLELIRQQLANELELIQKIDRLCLSTLGKDFAQSLSVGFDERQALQACRVFSSDQIPKVNQRPMGVSNIRFVTDLDMASSARERFPRNGLAELVRGGVAAEKARIN